MSPGVKGSPAMLILFSLFSVGSSDRRSIVFCRCVVRRGGGGGRRAGHSQDSCLDAPGSTRRREREGGTRARGLSHELPSVPDLAQRNPTHVFIRFGSVVKLNRLSQVKAPREPDWKHCPWCIYPGAHETLEVVLAPRLHFGRC